MNVKIYHIFLIITILVGFIACQDDFPGNDIAPVGEGEAELTVTLTYEQEPSVDLKSRAYEGGDPGDAIQNISTLHMLVYDEQGYLVKHYPVIDDNGSHDPEISNVKNFADVDNREEGSASDDAKTGRVTFNMILHSNKYYIYAVANVNNFSQYSSQFQTREGLKSISFDWDSITTVNNGQMFGVFAVGEANRKQTDDKTIVIRRNDTQLWCYVKRLASKVTVAFDGSQLFDNVEIYISTISIKDIAKNCALGVQNRPGQLADGTMADKNKRYDLDNGLIASGKTVTVQELPDDRVGIVPTAFEHICNGKHKNLGMGDNNADNSVVHSQDSKALYFYENAQGEGKNKKQDINGDSEVDFPEGNDETKAGWKDDMPYGTYVEVKGYYRCTLNDGRMGYGPITYRFMLGQDTEKDYNVFRNTHYRLTLCFKGYGNEADWHIVYNEPTGIYSSSPQYISYVYLKNMTTSVKVVGEMESPLKAHIMGSDNDDRDTWMTAAQKAKDDSVLKSQTYWRPWGLADGSNKTFPDPKKSKDPITTSQPFFYQGTTTGNVEGPWVSFLSLKKIMKQRVEGPNQYDLITEQTDDKYFETYNRTYWNGRKLGDCEYNSTPNGLNQTYKDEEIGNYRVESTKGYEVDDPDNPGQKKQIITERVFSVPLYTRGNILVGKSGFVGNNPYESFPRKETVRYAAKVKDPDNPGAFKWEVVYVDVIQVRRITNPKAIYYSNGTGQTFHVTLAHLLTPDAEEFTPVVSDGAWSAEVWPGDGSAAVGVVALSNTPDGIEPTSVSQSYVNRIEGDDEHKIDFNINILGKGYAVVKVRYHNYTCEHDIFVCNDYSAPVQLTNDQTRLWSTANVLYFNGTTPVLAKSPLDEGSLFRRGVNIAITKDNNEVNKPMEAPIKDYSVRLPNKSIATMSWDNLAYTKVDNAYKSSSASSWNIAGSGNQRIARIDDYYTLISLDENAVDFHIKRAYGIAYGDGMTKTEMNVHQAQGYERENGGANCMRGVVIYNTNTSKHIFLPLGASGHGRRKSIVGWQPEPKDSPGTLRYASRTRLYTWNNGAGAYDNYNSVLATRPLFYDIYRRPGAIYWCRNRYEINQTDALGQSTTASGTTDKLRASCSSAIDINFHTMGFEGFINNAAKAANGSDADACFIRTLGYSVTP